MPFDTKSTARWGTMNVNRMLRHCTLWDEMIRQNRKHKRMPAGRVIGRLLLKKETGDEGPMRKTIPRPRNGKQGKRTVTSKP